jgi:UDP-N-acetylmuramoyl-L-alanyl-D-glutamate--2,6-diaminopimelate ligase
MRVKTLDQVLAHIPGVEREKFSGMQVAEITHNSLRAGPQSLFVAISGYQTDGHKYVKSARENGAVAAVVERVVPDVDIPQIVVQDSRDALARVSLNLYQPEIDAMQLIGVTGTNGKTTTSLLVQSILDSSGMHSGLIGTMYYKIGNQYTPAWNTTPEASDLCRMYYQMSQAGQFCCVLEVSSHALALKRVKYQTFDIAIFTNLTQDHLDFHENMEDYFNAKKLLFSQLKPTGTAVINHNDEYGQKLIAQQTGKIITFGTNPAADVHPIAISGDINGIRMQVKYKNETLSITSPLIGEFNIENLLAAVATGFALNINGDKICTGIAKMRNIPGRLETIQLSDNRTVVVDYSHTPDALQKALKVLRLLTEKRLLVVFGCGGDRDKAKRPIMGRIASHGADHVFVTSDNPRSEDPEKIIADIREGINDHKKTIIQPDRRNAIHQAIQLAKPGDIVLIAGKGHEDYQEIQGVKHPFDDRKIVREFQA